MRQSDFAFANDVRAAVELRTPRTSRMLLTSSIALGAAGLVWANFAVLDEVKRGNGKVVPSRQIQVVQSLEGGIVDAILPSLSHSYFASRFTVVQLLLTQSFNCMRWVVTRPAWL